VQQQLLLLIWDTKALANTFMLNITCAQQHFAAPAAAAAAAAAAGWPA
jgi:hypothetical protein